jgi:hydroxyethylthiazole kinase-like uncharacterized protein yjeF
MTTGREILSVAELAAADRASADSGVDALTLVERAGAAVADAVQARWTRRSVVVLCGPGLNGADGYVAARRLAEAGWPVRVLASAHPAHGPAERAAAAFSGPVESLSPAALGDAALVVDALYGAGLARALDGMAADTLRAAADRRLPLVAVDLPSGLQGDAAKPLAYAPTATLTVTFHRKKRAHVLEPGRGHCGEVVVADIGLPAPAGEAATLWENGPELWEARFPWPVNEGHKHARGRLGLVCGAQLYTGAARLAARAGLRAGAGIVRLFCPPEAAPVNAAHLEAIMLRSFETDTELEAHAEVMDAMVIGPAAGVDDSTMANLFALARTGVAMVVDADALTVFRDEPEELFASLDRDDVLTPHTGEFERIFPGFLASEPEKVAAARRAAARAGAVVLLKGSDTVIAAPNGRAAVNTNATPWLATAGSGDVLAGLIGGLVAQGMDSFDAACAGVWMHAEAGRSFGPGLIAEDLPELVPGVLRTLYARREGAGLRNPPEART